jgi:hypothetical protein
MRTITSFALACASLAASQSAFALAQTCLDDCIGGGGGDVGFGGIVFPTVNVTGDKWWTGMQIMLPPAAGVGGPISFGGTTPAPVSPTAQTQEQYDAQRATCLSNCATQNTYNLNQCIISSAALADRLSYVPAGTALTMAVTAAWLTRNAWTTVGAMGGGYGLGVAYIADRVRINNDYCNGQAARDYNSCISATCHALLLAPLALLRRRRREEEDANA